MSAVHGQQHVAGQDPLLGIQAYHSRKLEAPQKSIYARYSARSTSHKPGHDYLLQGGSQKERSFAQRHLHQLIQSKKRSKSFDQARDVAARKALQRHRKQERQQLEHLYPEFSRFDMGHIAEQQ